MIYFIDMKLGRKKDIFVALSKEEAERIRIQHEALGWQVKVQPYLLHLQPKAEVSHDPN